MRHFIGHHEWSTRATQCDAFTLGQSVSSHFHILILHLVVNEDAHFLRLIYSVTDGPPATALGFNPPVPDLMKQRPRPSDEPIMTPWLLTRYCVTGLYVGIATVGVFIGHYLEQGITLSQLTSWGKCGQSWSPSNPDISCSDLFTGHGRMLPQTLSLTTLVAMEMLKALAAVSVDNSLFTVGPQQNPLLVLGVVVPSMLHLLVVYSSKLGLSGLGESFGMVPLSMQNWISILMWSAPILIVEELLKAVGRRVNEKAKIKNNASCTVSV